ncbi:MAG: cold shock domain-containing protein [Actinomycetaceae bacterium]|nr:cold shock domain-containing protein [Actinomycetaceae bacterium]
MPAGKVKWFDKEKGFGFVAGNDGEEVFLHASALPEDVHDIKPGTKIEYSVADGRRGPQALAVTLLEDLPSIAKSKRKSAEEMVPIVEDLIKMLDQASGSLRRGKYPENGSKIAQVLRVVAQSFDA